jgi:hypothetical protein
MVTEKKNCGNCKHWGGSNDGGKPERRYCSNFGVMTYPSDDCDPRSGAGWSPKEEPDPGHYLILRPGARIRNAVGGDAPRFEEFLRLVTATREINERLKVLEESE